VKTTEKDGGKPIGRSSQSGGVWKIKNVAAMNPKEKLFTRKGGAKGPNRVAL